jgi:Tol biopolymer transport system component
VGVGGLVYYTVSEIDERVGVTQSLWLVDRDGGVPRRLGEELGDLGAVAPAPDGTAFAVLAESQGVRQIWLVPVDGGDARAVTALAQGVDEQPVWSPDGTAVAFTTRPPRRDRSLP